MGFWEYVVNIAVVIFFVLLNGFFVAAEFAIVKVRSTQIEPLVQKGNWRAKIAKDIIAHLDAYLSATQLGITMASLALGWVGEPFVASMFAPYFTGLGVTDPRLIQGISFAIAFSIITFLHIVIGEQAPKWLAIQKARTTTLWVAYPLRLFFVVFKPFIWGLNSAANAIVHVVGIHSVSESEVAHSEEELRLLLTQDKRVSVRSRNIVLNAMDFRRKQARHSMTPRKEIVALLNADPVSENIALMRESKFSRLPVYKESIDNIIGIVHTKDIFLVDRHLRHDFSLDSVLRDAVFLPETATLERVLETMLGKKTHMVILADEYGGTAGLICLENVLEELVGDIQDEFDKEAPEITKLNENEYLVHGNITTNDVERLINQELSPRDIISIGGFIIERLGTIPKQGEKLRIDGTEFIVEKVVDNVVETIRIKRLPPPTDVEEPKKE
ncbi:MAG: hemolysin family protein [Bacteroidota bacterium]